MQWYYKLDAQKIGPVTEEEFESLVKNNTIISSTPVWSELTGKWIVYGEYKGGSTATVAVAATAVCAECGKTFSSDNMVKYGQYTVCAACKPVFFQKVQEGARLPNSLVYGGFWQRFGAKFIDGLILYAVNTAISLVATGTLVSARGQNPAAVGGAMLAVFGLQMLIAAAYTIFFVGKFQATPGKMALGLKIITPDGGTISYGRAVGRYFAEFLSSIILGIGYLMAAFDQEKRTLHDRVASTRVVKK